MKITRCEYFQYKVALHKPLIIGKQTVSSREGFVLVLYDEKNNLGLGEISPLPGLSKENLQDIKPQLDKLEKIVLEKTVPSTGLLTDSLKTWLKTFMLVPSARFGFEMAVLNLMANRKNVFLKDLIAEDRTDTEVPLCGLLPGPVQDPLQEAEDLIEKGIKAVKLKVGRAGIDEDIRLIQAINLKIEGKAVLRLDANQKWDLSKAVLLGNEIGCAAVEYIEEPFSDPTQYDEFFMKTTIPVALDESILKLDFNEIKSLSSVDYLIVKPTVIGGIVKTWDLMNQAQRMGLSSVISSSFETNLGLSALADLAACNRIGHPCGLDTFKWFKENLLKEPLEVTHGMLPLRKPVKSLDELNQNYLQKIE